jgi:hypothetical protein
MATKSIKQFTMAQFDKLVDGIEKRIALTVKDIQKAAVFAVYHSLTNPADLTDGRNSSPANKLFNAVGTSVRRQALATFFEKYGNLAYMKDEKAIKFFDAGHVQSTFDEAYLMSKPWQDATPEGNITSAYDVFADLQALLKKYERAVTKSGEKVREVKHANMIAVLKTLVANPDADYSVTTEESFTED